MGSWCMRLRETLSQKPWYSWFVFCFIVMGAFMVNVDSTSVNVALPIIQEEFGISASTLQWVMTAYLLMVTGLLPTIGMLADMTGRKRIYLIGVAILGVGSILCSLATNIAQLIAFRVFQAIGGAMIMGNVSAMVTDIFPQGQRGRPLGTVTSVVAVATIVGPSLGGILTDLFSWKMIFWINVPICFLSMAGVLLFMPSKRPEKAAAKPFDLKGSVLFFIATAGLLLFISNGPNWGWIGFPSGMAAAVAAVGWLLFIRTEIRHENPLINLQYFRNPMFSMAALTGFVSYVLTFFPAILMPLYMHNVLHLSPMTIGLLITPQAIAMSIISPFSGWMTDRLNVHLPTLSGMGLMGVALWMMARFDAATVAAEIVAAFSLFGFGFGLFNVANNLSIIESVPNRAGLLSGLVATIRNFGRVSGVALAVLLLDIGLGIYGAAENYHKAVSLAFLGGTILALSAFLVLLIRLRRLRESVFKRKKIAREAQ